MSPHCKNESAVPTPFVVSNLCECDTWCSPSTPGCHTSTLGCHLSTLGCHCSTHGVTLAPLGCHHSTKSWCHIRTHAIFNSASEQVTAMFITTTQLLGLTYKSTYVRSHKLHILFHSHKHRLTVKSYLLACRSI